MGIPARFSRHSIALHSLIAWNHILNYSGFNMSYMWLAIGSRRTIKEHIGRSILPTLYRFFKNLVIIPKFKRSLFTVYKVHISFDFSVHYNSLFPSKKCRGKRTAPTMVNYI